MTIVVGFGIDTHSGSGLDLAAAIARTTGDPLVLACIVHDSWHSLRAGAGVDDEWHRVSRAQADETLDAARSRIGDEVAVVSTVRTARSVPQALIEVSRDRHARLTVVGSSAQGPLGHIALGSTSDRLVHSAHLPVALAPRGYRGAARTIDRIVMALDPTASDVALGDEVAALATWFGCPVDVATFAVRSGTVTAFAAFADQGVQAAWSTSVRAHQARAVERITAAAPGVTATTTQAVTGESWPEALDAYPWEPGDLLVVGSSRHGPLARVFLGSTATRIVHHCPVPVVVLPRPRDL